MLRLAFEVAGMETRLGPASRDIDPVFQHSRRHFVGFVRDPAPSMLLKMLFNMLGSFSSPRRLVLKASLLMRVPANDIF